MMQLPTPAYGSDLIIDERVRVGLAVESMRRHTTDEGWQLFAGLQHAGYRLAGFNIETPVKKAWQWSPGTLRNLTHVPSVLELLNPGVVVLQDKREWEGRTAGCGFDSSERFTDVTALAQRPDVFKLTVLKDAQNNPDYHRQSAEEIGCHAWVVYYDPERVCQLAPFVRPQHVVRTYHTVDRELVPAFDVKDRQPLAVISGAVSSAYPLRQQLCQSLDAFRDHSRQHLLVHHRHPGYRRDGCVTPAYLEMLSRYRVAVCTASRYGYALRKIMEATACGCVVITDLPETDCLPEIDGNLVRIKFNPERPIAQLVRVRAAIVKAIEIYDPERQRDFAERAKAYYDYRVMGVKLANDIETMRQNYNGRTRQESTV